MAWFTFEIDASSRATLDRHTQALALLTSAIQQTGAKMATALDRLAAEVADLASAEQTLATVTASVIAALSNYAAQVADLTNQLTIALAQSNDAAIEAVVEQFDALSNKIVEDAVALQSAIPQAPTP